MLLNSQHMHAHLHREAHTKIHIFINPWLLDLILVLLNDSLLSLEFMRR